MVEYVLAAGMFLEVERHGAGQRGVAFEQEKMRPPAGSRRRAAGVLQRGQKFVPDERVIAGETVPFVRSHVVERIDHMYFDLAVKQAYLPSELLCRALGAARNGYS